MTWIELVAEIAERAYWLCFLFMFGCFLLRWIGR